jgi:hypothetical protein
VLSVVVLCCRLRADLLLGVATVSLSALLQECWVDGYAPVYAMMARADGSKEQQEKVQVCCAAAAAAAAGWCP